MKTAILMFTAAVATAVPAAAQQPGPTAYFQAAGAVKAEYAAAERRLAADERQAPAALPADRAALAMEEFKLKQAQDAFQDSMTDALDLVSDTINGDRAALNAAVSNLKAAAHSLDVLVAGWSMDKAPAALSGVVAAQSEFNRAAEKYAIDVYRAAKMPPSQEFWHKIAIVDAASAQVFVALAALQPASAEPPKPGEAAPPADKGVQPEAEAVAAAKALAAAADARYRAAWERYDLAALNPAWQDIRAAQAELTRSEEAYLAASQKTPWERPAAPPPPLSGLF
jgi:hypothetical protein